jgi:hypothetical protein
LRRQAVPEKFRIAGINFDESRSPRPNRGTLTSDGNVSGIGSALIDGTATMEFGPKRQRFLEPSSWLAANIIVGNIELCIISTVVKAGFRSGVPASLYDVRSRTTSGAMKWAGGIGRHEATDFSLAERRANSVPSAPDQ